MMDTRSSTTFRALATSEQFGDYTMESADTSRSFALSAWVKSPAKRVFDVALTLLSLPVALPLLGILALLVKLTSHGPVFHIQERLGRGGLRFHMLKFRSMKHLRAQTGPALTQPNDPRLTAVGEWLRQWKLDEIPQLWNVL